MWLLSGSQRSNPPSYTRPPPPGPSQKLAGWVAVLAYLFCVSGLPAKGNGGGSLGLHIPKLGFQVCSFPFVFTFLKKWC